MHYMITSGEYELGWGGIFTTESLKNAIIANIDAGYPILANGISGADPEALITLPCLLYTSPSPRDS